jgi:hypothetical protein
MLSSLGTLLCLFIADESEIALITPDDRGGEVSLGEVTKEFERYGVTGDEMSLPEAEEVLGSIGSRLKALTRNARSEARVGLLDGACDIEKVPFISHLFSEERLRQVLDFAIIWSELVLLDTRRGDGVEGPAGGC